MFISRVDRNLRFLSVSLAVEKVLGFPPQECIGKTKSEIGVPKNLSKPWDQEIRNVFDTGREGVFEFSIQTSNSLRSYHCQMVPEFDEDGSAVESVLCVTADVTDLKRGDDALSQLASLMQSSNDAIVSQTLEGVITSWNEAAERIYGYSAEEAIGRSATMLRPTDRVDEISKIIGRVKRGEVVSDHETVRLRKDGARVDVSLTLSPLVNATGRITGVSSISRDITEQKRSAEIALWQELRLLQADKMASLGVLVSGMAHEINNPNNYILLNSRILSNVWKDLRLILEQYYEKVGDFSLGALPYPQAYEEIGQVVSGIAEGSLRIEKIVRNLKDYARKDTGNLNEAVNVNTVIEAALVIMNSLIKNSTDLFSVSYVHNLPLIKGNAQQLEQVIINLVANACQSLSGKEKKIAVSTRYFKQARRIMIEIHDEGVGIASENLKFILDPFFTTKRDSGGTGLGLSSSHSIIKNHGGELVFVSQPGKGTTATVILPVAQR